MEGAAPSLGGNLESLIQDMGLAQEVVGVEMLEGAGDEPRRVVVVTVFPVGAAVAGALLDRKSVV